METTDAVVDFYEDSQNSRLMPGKKDFISIKKNVHKQKRLVLSNLKELYSSFKTQHPEIKIGFSKFCSLRPRWYVLPSAHRTHSVCVRTYHQNAKLILLPIDANYQELFKLIVCDPENKECMIHRCSNCPTTADLLEEKLYELIGDIDEDETIEFNQWVNTDRADLITQRVSVHEYVALVIEQLVKLTAHSYISKGQSRYLKE